MASQRTVRSIIVTKPPQLRSRRTLILGADNAVEDWCLDHRISFVTTLPQSGFTPDTILIWDAAKIDPAVRSRAPEILKLVESGTRLVILDQKSWDWPELLDYQISGRMPRRNGNEAPDAVPHDAYPCAGTDEWIAIAVETDDLRVLDYNGHRVFSLFHLQELGKPLIYEPDGRKMEVFMD